MAKLFDIDNKRKQVKEAAQKYYSTGDSDFDDATFDAAVEELRQADPNDPLVNEIGWGYDVDLDTTPGEKVAHRYGVAGSLKKIHTIDEIQKWVGLHPLNVSAKLDGLSCVAYYDKGKLSRALTRGDGHIGIDITPKFKKIVGEYNLNDSRFSGAIRGELLMTLYNFAQFKAKNPEAKNPRNSAVGLIGKEGLDDLEFVSFVPYTIVGIDFDSEKNIFHDIQSMRDFLAANFKVIVPDTTMIIERDLESAKSLFDSWARTYPIDGLVLTLSIITTPRYDINAMSVEYNALALKFESEIAHARVIKVEWNLGKNGLIVPKVQIEPTELVGSTVQFATGFNAQFIKENGVGPGAVIEITKAGEVIPYIKSVVEPVVPSIPDACPVCGVPVRWDGVHITCSNGSCSGQKDADLQVWCMTLAPVDGLGWTLIKKFCDLVNVHTVEELMELEPKDLTVLPVGSQSAMFSEMIRKLNEDQFPLAKAIEAVNIPRFGTKTSQQLAAHPDAFKIILSGVSVSQVCQQINLGDANTEALSTNLDKLYRLDMIQDRIIYQTAPKVERKGKVAITGVLSVPRDKFEEELRDAGYEPGGLTKQSLYLIASVPSNTSKYRYALEHNIPIITEDEFRRKYL
jgi:DNA ligase (NAD+)